MQSRTRRPSKQTIRVLEALASDPASWRYGLELARLTGLMSGSLYPILIRCAERGLVEAKWIEAVEIGRPPRHAYRILPSGIASLRAERVSSHFSLKEQLT